MRRVHGLLPIGGFTGDRQVVARIDQHGQSGPDELLVVNDSHFDCHVIHSRRVNARAPGTRRRLWAQPKTTHRIMRCVLACPPGLARRDRFG